MSDLPDWVHEKPITSLAELAAQAEPQPTTAPADDLLTKVRHLAACRRARDEAKRQYEAAFDAFLAEHELLVSQRDRCVEDALDAEEEVRDAALAAYALSGEKRLCAGLGIRVETRLNYPPERATEWAIEHKLALKLDTPAFEQIARVSPPFFVVVRQEPVATIATDLDKAIGGNE